MRTSIRKQTLPTKWIIKCSLPLYYKDHSDALVIKKKTPGVSTDPHLTVCSNRSCNVYRMWCKQNKLPLEHTLTCDAAGICDNTW
jgi:hypothetical protein